MKGRSTYIVLLYTCSLFFSITTHHVMRTEQLLDSALATTPQTRNKKLPKKPWTIIVYIAADNDLRGFAARNIKQMSTIGSNKHCNMVAHLDIRITGNKKVTRRYYIENNKVLHMNADDSKSQQMDSGDPNTLISCCQWAMSDYPADNYMLVFWNHGTGIIDPATGRVMNSLDLFSFNATTNKLDLDRSIGFLDILTMIEKEQRGICWDDSTGHYLTNQKLESALAHISKNFLGGKKFSIIAFDACLMSMLEVANILKPYAHVMIGSQEVELSTGWDYTKALSLFNNQAPNKVDLAKHIVAMYGQAYHKVTNDYTQSAINLDTLDEVEKNINTLAQLLLECLKKQKDHSVKNAIRASSNKLLCTHFDEPSYIDLHHFLTNLQTNLKHFSFSNTHEGTTLINAVQSTITHGLSLVEKNILAYISGPNVSKARGMSIYFPDRRIHSSYRKTKFAASNNWSNFLTQYLLN